MATKKKTGGTSARQKKATGGRRASGRARGGDAPAPSDAAAGSRPARKHTQPKDSSRSGGERTQDARGRTKRGTSGGSAAAPRPTPTKKAPSPRKAASKPTKREGDPANPKRTEELPVADRAAPAAGGEPGVAPTTQVVTAEEPAPKAVPDASPAPGDASPPSEEPTPTPIARAPSKPAPVPTPAPGSAPPAADTAFDEATDPSVAAQIRELEERLGGMIRDAEPDDSEEPPASLREQVSFAAREVVDRLAAPVERPGHDDGGVVDAVRGLLSSDYYLRQWGRLGMRNRSEEVDDFGLDAVYERRLRPLWDFLYKRYFRVEVEGIENVPSEGRCLIVANHSGTIPLDGVMLRACLRIEHPAARELRWLSEDFIYHLPFVGAFMSRIGAVRACQENAERLLSKDALVAVFPEGVKGIGKLYRDRYRLQRFGRGGFIRLCLRSQTPLVPCAVIGAEEASPMLYRDELLSRALGLPYLPVTPTFPWLGPAGLIPAPTKWRIIFGEPVDVSQYDPSAAEDHVLVARLSESVRTSIQQMLDVGVGQRRSVWGG